jgi:hypothetical protein
MDKILKMVDVKQKIKEKELMEADMEVDEEMVSKVKKVEKVDPFFQVDDGEAEVKSM